MGIPNNYPVFLEIGGNMVRRSTLSISLYYATGCIEKEVSMHPDNVASVSVSVCHGKFDGFRGLFPLFDGEVSRCLTHDNVAHDDVECKACIGREGAAKVL